MGKSEYHTALRILSNELISGAGKRSLLSNATSKQKLEEFIIASFINKEEGWRDDLEYILLEHCPDRNKEYMSLVNFAYDVLRRSSEITKPN